MASLAASPAPAPDRFAAVDASGAATHAVDWRAFEALPARARWDALARSVAEPNPFHEAWYLLPALRAFDPRSSVGLLTVEQEGALIGLIPMRTQPRYYGRPIPHLSTWTHANSFLGAPLVATGHEATFWTALLAWADRQSGSALFLHLPQMPLGGPLYAALQSVTAGQNRKLALVHREERAMLGADMSPELYWETSLSGKKRKELRRQAARLAEHGEVRIERREDADDLEQWIEAFLTLEHSGWKGAAGSALASHHSTATLFREAIAGAAAQGKLERLTLWFDRQPIAMLAQFLTPPGAFSYKTAFDERFARFSPGVLLQRENLALLTRAQIGWCDSCASADHPMIDHIWREHRAIGHLSIPIGGRARRALFGLLARFERQYPA